jgi:mannitol-specific phosphotransferase system IIBC component
METVWYGVLSVMAIGIGIALRYGVYTMLVKNNGWLPEKATKVANIVGASGLSLILLVLVGRAFLTAH